MTVSGIDKSLLNAPGNRNPQPNPDAVEIFCRPCVTNCLVAAVCGWHEFHQRTVVEIETMERHGQYPVIASHS